MTEGNAARNFRSTDYERSANDWYVEPKWCVEQLFDVVNFDDSWIWDPCAGGGNIPEVARARNRFVIATDLVDRGYRHLDQTWDVFSTGGVPLCVKPSMKISVVTNPPFALAAKIVQRMLTLVDFRLAIIQQLSFLASRARYELFSEFPPSDVLILSKRPSMPPGHMIAEMGDKAFKGGTSDFCWIVWSRPHDRPTTMRWLSPADAA